MMNKYWSPETKNWSPQLKDYVDRILGEEKIKKQKIFDSQSPEEREKQVQYDRWRFKRPMRAWDSL